MGDLYRISGERLSGIADQARRLGKRSGRLTPGQMEEVLRAIEPADRMICVLNGSERMLGTVMDQITDQAVTQTRFVPGGQVKDVTTPAELSGPMCHYNDVLLPGIPAQMLEEYPYAFIRKNTSEKLYQLIFSQTGFFFNGSSLKDNKNVINPKYTFPMGRTMDNAWRNANNVTSSGWTLDETRLLIWSCFDIPQGSPNGEEIYFEATEPEPLGKFYYNGTLLPGLDRNVLAEYPYVWIRKNETSGYYDLFYSTAAFYVVDTDSMSGSNITKPWYRIAIDGADKADNWTYYQNSTANLNIDETRTVLWANHDILNSKDAEPTDIYFAGSEPVPAEQES